MPKPGTLLQNRLAGPFDREQILKHSGPGESSLRKRWRCPEGRPPDRVLPGLGGPLLAAWSREVGPIFPMPQPLALLSGPEPSGTGRAAGTTAQYRSILAVFSGFLGSRAEKQELLAPGWSGGLLGRAPVEWVANLREREHGLFMPGLLRFPDSLDQLAGAGDWDAAFIFASGLPGSQLKILCLRSFV